jgi:rhodanese-related sulfurtransferase
MNSISRLELKKKIDEGEDIQLVDVRGKECCHDAGHLPGAKSIPLLEIEARAPTELEKDKPVVVYCGSFNCALSPRAAEILKSRRGFKKVIDYEGGLKDWTQARYPVEKQG